MLKKRILSFVLTMVLCAAQLTNVGAAALEEPVILESNAEDMAEGKNAVAVNEDAVSYVYVESDLVTVGAEQNVVIGMYEEGIVLENAELSYVREETGEIFKVSVDNQIEGAVLFSMNIPQTGTYQIYSLSYGTEEKYYIDFSDKDYTFDVILENEPAVSVYAADASGNFVETVGGDVQSTVEEALIKAASSRPAVYSRTTANNLVIALDAGHDAKHAGAQGNGYSEENITLKLAKYVKAELEQYAGVSVYLTRETEACPYPSSANNIADIKQRIDAAVEFGATTLVSFHLNSYTNSAATGAEVYYPEGNSQIAANGKELAQDIQDQLVALGLKDREIKSMDYTINEYSLEKGIIGVLIEHCYISNPNDVEYIKDDAAIKKMAQADAAGIISYFGLTDKKEQIALADGQYQIASAEADGYLIEVADASTADSANVQVGVQGTNVSQKFDIEAVGNGYYKIINSNSGKAVDIRFGYTADGTNIHQYEWNESDAQLWQFYDAGNGLYFIKSKLGTYLTRSGNNVVSSSYTGTVAQQWDIFVEGEDDKEEDGTTDVVEVAEGECYIVSISDGAVIEVADASVQNSANVQVGGLGANDSQKFNIISLDNGYYKIENMNSGKVVDVRFGYTTDGTNVHQYEWNESDAQMWQFYDSGDGMYYIKSKLGTYLTRTGSNVVSSSFTGSDEQKWNILKEEFVLVEEGSYTIYSGIPGGGVMDVKFAYKTDGANVQQYEPNGTAAQKWKIQHVGDMAYKFVNENSGKVLTSEVGTEKTDLNVYQHEWNGSDAQLWYFVDAGDGQYRIKSKTGMYLSVHADTASNSANICCEIWEGTDGQFWTLKKLLQTGEEYTFAKVSDGAYVLYSGLENDCVISVQSGSKAENAYVVNAAYTKSYAQEWNITAVDENWYKLESRNSGKMLTTNGVTAYQAEWNGSDGQLWRFVETKDGYVYIASKTGKLLDVKWGNVNSGTDIHMHVLNGSAAQKWALESIVTGSQVENGIYTIQTQLIGGGVLDVANASAADGANVYEYESTGSISQQWNVQQYDGEWYQIINANSGLALDVKFGATADGTNVQQYSFNGSDAQLWRFMDAGNGNFYIQSKLGKYLDINSAGTANGTNVHIYSFNGTNAQIWSLKIAEDVKYAAIEDGTYVIGSVLSETMAVSVEDASNENSANVQLELNENTVYQMWDIKAVSDGYYKIVNLGSGKALDVRFGYTTNGTNIYQYDWNESRAQLWRFVEAEDGSYYIQSKLGPMMNLENELCEDPTNISIFEKTESAAQRWTLNAPLYNIMGASQITIEQMVTMFNKYTAKYGGEYNTELYAEKGAPTIRDFCTILYHEAEAEGVRAEVLWAQVILETGWLQYKGSSIKQEQCNFGGLGATDGGASGAVFEDVTTGLRAQTQHLKAYASTEELNQTCVDPRYHLVKKGCAPYVEWLGQQENPYGYGWATGAGYGSKLIALIQQTLSN